MRDSQTSVDSCGREWQGETRAHRLSLLLVRWIGSFLLAGKILWRGLRRALGKQAPGTCVVLCYHAVPARDRPQFARQMDDLLRWAKPVPATFNGPLADGVHHVAITFDDGFQSVVDNALPELAKRNIHATLFVPTGNLGDKPRWRLPSGHPLKSELIVSDERLRRLPSELVTIGSHTVTHPFLSELDEDRAREELAGSRSMLESLLNRSITLFCFPSGDHNQALLDMAREAGYERTFTTVPSLALLTPGEFATGRVLVSASDSRALFRAKLMGTCFWVPQARAFKRKLKGLLRGHWAGPRS